MNSRERVKITLNHEEPDMVPIDLGGHQSGIHIKAYKKLLDYLEIKDSDIQYCDFVQQIALPCEELLERFKIDVRYIRPLGGMVNIKFIFLTFRTFRQIMSLTASRGIIPYPFFTHGIEMNANPWLINIMCD